MGTDGPVTMLRSKAGDSQRLCEKMNHSKIVRIHYNGHKLELAFKNVTKTKPRRPVPTGLKLYMKLFC